MADPSAAPSSTQIQKPVKRSFFKKPAWATADESKAEKPQAEAESFSHASRIFQELVEQKEKDKAKQKERLERRKKRKSDESRDRHNKRRRASRDNEGSESPARVRPADSSGRTPQITRPSRIATRSTTDPASLSARYEDALKPIESRTEIISSNTIDLGDSEDSDHSDNPATITVPSPTTVPIVLDDDSDALSDLEVRSTTIRLPERRRLNDASTNIPNSATPTANSPPKPDPIVRILITSDIPGTNPLLVSRKLSQNLKDVRLAWVTRQQFPEGITPDVVFLTYRNRRLWDLTTCKSIGLEVDAHGNIRQKDHENDVFDDMDDKVHLVAATKEILVEMKRRAETAIQESKPAVEEVIEEEVVEESPRIRVILEPRGKEKFKLSVKADTTFEAIAHACRRNYKLSADVQVFLMFDGDRLDPNDTVGDSEIQDMDAVEVHIK